jgi:shikimate kinase
MNGPIVLVGNMGAGKTAVARSLGLLTGWAVIDTDTMVSEGAGMSIPDIFATKGEPAFRELERAALSTAVRLPTAIVSCGGGIVEHPGSLKLIASCPVVVYLAAEPEELARRIRDPAGRPLLEGKDVEATLALLNARRDPLYRAVATRIVHTTGKTPDEIAEEILSE